MMLERREVKLLERIEQELKTAGRVERRRGTTTIDNIEAWCEAHDLELGDYRWGNTLRFDRRLLATIDATLKSLHQPRLG